MKLSIVIPVFNEKNTIEKILTKVEKAALPRGVKRELVIVDDFSTDGTREFLNKIDKKNYTILYHDVNQGKGAALRTGYAHCSGDIVIVQDADMEYNPDEYSMLIEPIIDGRADVVYGSRFMEGKPHKVVKFWHMVGNKFITLLSNMFTNLHLTDMETCYKVFRREIIQNIELEENRFGIEPEVTAKIAELVNQNKISLYEIAISYDNRAFDEGKKIGMKDAFRALWCMIKYNHTFFARIVRYSIIGIFVALSQFITIIAIVEGLDIRNILGQNIAYAISIEVSIIMGFIMHSIFTWVYSFRSIKNVLVKFIQFNMITGISFFIRQVLFYSLSVLGVEYKLNTIIGIIIAIIINFVGYNKIVFKDRNDSN